MGEVISMQDFRAKQAEAKTRAKEAVVARSLEKPVKVAQQGGIAPIGAALVQDGGKTAFDYGALISDSMMVIIRRVLSHVAQKGLPTECSLIISFKTRTKDVSMPDWLKAKYQDEITVVLDEWFQGLEVFEDGFGVVLNFGDEKTALYVPFDAITQFADAKAEFGVRFDRSAEVGEQPEPPAPLIA